MHRPGYFKEYREKNREKLRERARQNALRYWHKYHSKKRVYRWQELGYASFKEYQQAYYKQWYATNRERHLANCRAYRSRSKTVRQDKKYRDWYARVYVDNSTQKQHKSMV